MRIEISLLILAIVLVFLSGRSVLSPAKGLSSAANNTQIQEHLRDFEKSHQPVVEFRSQDFSERLNPANLLPFFHQLDPQLLKAYQAYRLTCKAKPPSDDPVIVKLWQWQAHLCGAPLPEDFFQTGPLFHPSGHSYAWLKDQGPLWVQEHLPKIHISELSVSGLPAPYEQLRTLSWEQLTQIWNEEHVILSELFVLIKKDGEKDRYKIYPRKDWNHYWQSKELKPSIPVKGAPCHLSNSLCWETSQGLLSKQQAIELLLYLSILLTGLMIWVVSRRAQQRDADSKRLKFSLEMLAHEIRTPVTNLSLNMEVLREDFDAQTPKIQTSILRLFDQVERLKRIANSGQRYLSKETTARLLDARMSESKLQELIEHTLDPFLNDIELSFELAVATVRTDSFWAGICVKNVVENALKHGSKPVLVRVTSTAEDWSVTVSDQGQFQTVKGPTGLGIGLKLVGEILPEIGGKIRVTEQPTRVELRFRMVT